MMKPRNAILLLLATILLLDTTYNVVTFSERLYQKPISYASLNVETQKEITCLADNIYHEARGESEIGKEAVAHTTLNRVEQGKWADSICGVVKQRTRGVCQFSWICNKIIQTRAKNEQLYNECQSIAVAVYLDHDRKRNDVTQGAVFYHADYLKLDWTKLNYTKTVTIGHHVFYKI